MRGKNKCKILKQIRQKIADENDIPYVTSECSFQGECKGTCPKCEAELRYLEEQLAKRQKLGKTVTVAALAASLMTGLTACPAEKKEAPKTADTSVNQNMDSEGFDDIDSFWMGAAPVSESAEEDPTDPFVLIGEVPYEPSEDDPDILGHIDPEYLPEIEGDISYIEPDETEAIDPGMIAGMIAIDETTCEIPTDGDE